MPDPYKLMFLSELRRAAHITLEHMARDCGLVSRKGRESASTWEQGQSVPHARNRTRFIDYLGNTLGLRHEPARFMALWSILVEEWQWNPLSDEEWHQHFSHALATETDAPTVRSNTSASYAEALPPLAALPPGSRMPYSRNPLFVGRAADLRALSALLQPSNAAVIATACGGGGIGKTQLVIEFVHRYGQSFPAGVFWMSFADPHAVPAQIASCGDQDHMALDCDFASRPLEEQVGLVMEAWSSPLPRLLIFDGCEHPALLERWRPRGGGYHILLTSHRSEWCMSLGVRSLLLNALSRRESIDLLRAHCPDLSLNDPHLVAIAAELRDMPFALAMAGDVLARNRDQCTPAEYLRQLRERARPALDVRKRRFL
jgi:transcriptional regulator with XRE-family HTH domain